MFTRKEVKVRLVELGLNNKFSLRKSVDPWTGNDFQRLIIKIIGLKTPFSEIRRTLKRDNVVVYFERGY